jgi:hypothetical protein
VSVGLDEGFLNWLAGFIDGEGCFTINRSHHNGRGPMSLNCRFRLHLRDDDAEIIEEIRNRLGFGKVLRSNTRGNRNPSIGFYTHSIGDCKKLRDILLKCPLRAKKARDFKIWSLALDACINHKVGTSWDFVEFYRDALMSGRKYRAEQPSLVYNKQLPPDDLPLFFREVA